MSHLVELKARRIKETKFTQNNVRLRMIMQIYKHIKVLRQNKSSYDNLSRAWARFDRNISFGHFFNKF